MANNLRNIQLLRSNQVYESLGAAKTAILAQVTGESSTLQDGNPIIGRYMFTSGGTSEIKSVLGIVHKITGGTNTGTSVTFFESANDIAAKLAQLQAELDTTQASVGLGTGGTHVDQSTKKFISGQTTVEAEIAALNDVIDALDFTLAKDDNKVLVSLTQEDGQVTATSENITTVKLAGLASGSDAKIAATDTLGEALANIQAQIDAMDKAASPVDGQVVTTVTEADGKVTETKANVKDLQLGGYAKTSDIGAIASADTVNVALSKLENQIGANTITNTDGSITVTPTAGSSTDVKVHIKDNENVIKLDANGGGLYTNINLVKVTTGLSANVREKYQLLDSDAHQIGADIEIYKDSALVNIYIGHVDDSLTNADGQTGESPDTAVTSGNGDTALVYIMHLENDNYKLAAVNVQDFLEESEFASGVTATNHVVHGVVDPTSESVVTAYTQNGQNSTANVLSVGANGFKVGNIQAAIDAAVGKATTAVALQDDTQAGTAVQVDEHVTLSSSTADNGKVTYTIHTNDIASKASLDTEVARAKSAEAAIDGAVGLTKAENGEARSYGHTGAHYVSGTTVKGDVEQLDAAVYALSGKTVTDFTSANNSIDITTSKTSDDTITVNLGTDASNISGLTAVASSDEGAAKISGVTASDSVQTGIKNLYDSLASEVAARKAAVSGRTITGSNAIQVTETPNGDGFGSTVELKLDTTTLGTGAEASGTNNTNALTITQNGLFLSTNWECGTY